MTASVSARFFRPLLTLLLLGGMLAPVAPAIAAPRVKLGIEVLLASHMDLIRGKRIGLITNMSAIDDEGRSDIDRLAHVPGVTLAALFAPEHGLRADLNVEDIPNGRDPETGVPVYSLYGRDRAPTPAQMANLDVLLFDIQDAGSRFYTYSTTLGLCLEAAKKAGKPFVVLDRPDPITGLASGDMLDPAYKWFTGRYPLTTRHGMTIGELARYINGEAHIGCDLTVVPMQGWNRAMWYDQTGLPWRKPSPAMLSPETALYYVGIGMFEGTNADCRAPGHPFQWVGARWMDGARVADALSRRQLPGVRFWEERNKDEDGVRLSITDRAAFHPIDTAVVMMQEIKRLYPVAFKPYKGALGNMSGSDALYDLLCGNESLESLRARYQKDAEAYDRRRQPYLLYP